MNKLEYLNKKVKEVDERFEVGQGGEGFNLIFDDTLSCWTNGRGILRCPTWLEGEAFKFVVGRPLTEENQLILKGVKVFYEAYNQPKEYYVCIHDMFTPYGKKYVNLETEYLTYNFDSATETPSIQTKFTEEEIAEMPTEIQKAIECGFLVKEEVDE